MTTITRTNEAEKRIGLAELSPLTKDYFIIKARISDLFTDVATLLDRDWDGEHNDEVYRAFEDVTCLINGYLISKIDESIGIDERTEI